MRVYSMHYNDEIYIRNGLRLLDFPFEAKNLENSLVEM